MLLNVQEGLLELHMFDYVEGRMCTIVFLKRGVLGKG